jgi:formylglycine-generating enzyme required for sulfatase activity
MHALRIGCGAALMALAIGSPIAEAKPAALPAAAQTLRSVASVNLEAAALAIEDMAATWPDRYDASPHRAALKRLIERRDATIEAIGRGDTNAIAEAQTMSSGVRDALLANPLLDFDRLLVVRRGLDSPSGLGLPHNWEGNSSLPRRGYDNEIMVLESLRAGCESSTLFKPADGSFVGDLCLHVDASRLLFSSVATSGTFQVFEIGVDGRGLRQVTPDRDADVDNYDACYLPDGAVLFGSTATYLGVPCVFGSSHIANLYRLDPGTGGIRQVTFEQEHDWNPAVLPNGRVLYLRWEYTDAAHSNSRILFHMNPDGTDQRAYSRRGSFFPGSFFYARPLPGNPRRVIGVATGHHGTPRAGRLLILDPAMGLSDGDGIVQEIPGRGQAVDPIVRDGLVEGIWPRFLMPFPLSEKYFLVSAQLTQSGLWGIYLADVFDNLTLIKELPGSVLFQPLPLRPEPAPPAIASRVNTSTNTATVYIADLHAGPGLEGVPRGAVKRLRVYEYYFSHRGMGGLYGTLGLDGPWDIRRILGTVPVEPDGSAFFSVPANTPLAFQPIDAEGQALQLMRTWVTAMPGERISCAGCHESANAAPVLSSNAASRREPAPLTPWFGPARGFAFAREVQPVLDRHCVGCHGDGGTPPYLKGDRMLTDWSSQMAGHWGGGGKFSTSYFGLQRYVRRPGIESDRRMIPPMDFHFSTTELGQMLRKGHRGVRLDAESWERLATWADFNAPYYGTWGEIPPFNQPGGQQNHLRHVVARARELRREFVPMGPFPDFEAIPGTPAYDTTAAVPAPVASEAADALQIAGWPFAADEAARRQLASAPPGSEGLLRLPLSGTARRGPPVGRYIRIEAGPCRWLSLAEVQAFSGGHNVAAGRPATQSSISGGAGAGRAVDGNTDGRFGADSVTHTGNGESEWWEVDLGEATELERIVIWNRTDAAGERLADVAVQLLDASRTSVWSGKTGPTPGAQVALDLSDPYLDFVWIPAGEFKMGSADGHPDERPVHAARIARGYWMSKFEISNASFRRFDPRHESRNEDRHGYQFGITGYDQDGGDQPAVRVSWLDAMAFCRWLSEISGRTVALPTEAQWEWACRAGAATPYWFGDLAADFSPCANFGDAMLANFSGNPYVQDWKAAAHKNPNVYDNWIPQDARFNDGGFVTEPVGRYRANPWGLHDMHGNAWEWTRSAYRPYPSTNEGAPAEDRDPAERVVRGGSWYDRPFRGTSSFRLPYRPYQRVYNVGFRVIVEETLPAATQTTAL